MTLNEILSSLSTLNEEELLQINRSTIKYIKRQRQFEASAVGDSLSIGDRVTWSGRRGAQEGIVEKINRKNAKIKVGFTTWTVPMNMLTAA